MPVIEWLAPVKGESILDLGCGDGTLALKLQRSGCDVVGIDASPDMIAAAISSGLQASVCDGHQLPFVERFDAVFSNAALHWMLRPEAVIAGVWAALRPGGRFVGEFGGAGNVATIIDALESELHGLGVPAECPWFFPTPDAYQTMLEQAGFEVTKVALIPRATPLPGDVGGWLRTFAQPYTNVLPESQRDDLITTVVEKLKPRLCDAQGNWTADYVRLRFAAVKPGTHA
ncbi:class I SAM-dependent methyltransferase [Halopseudomonas salegens]|nr:class I SAM-dependent methyltransferase [Halopseudomonas salegens]